MIVYWPRGVLMPRHNSIDPAPVTVTGPASLSGFRQSVETPAAVWSVAYTSIKVSGRAVNIWRALAAQIAGRSRSIILPIYDREALRLIGTPSIADTSHSDGGDHSDGAPYASRRTHVIAASAVARGDRRMTAETILAPAIEAGHQFSIGHRFYRVMSIEAIDGNLTTFTFWPTAREDVIAGAELDFDRPVCKVRLMEDGAMNLQLDNGLHGFPSISFIEDPN